MSVRTRKRKAPGFVPGFKLPSNAERKSALGSVSETEERIYDFRSFERIPKPTSEDDWLAQYLVSRQTYDGFIQNNPWLRIRKRGGLCRYFGRFLSSGRTLSERYPDGVVNLVQIGSANSEVGPRIETLAEFAEIYLGVGIRVLDPLEIVETKQRVDLDGISINFRRCGDKIQLKISSILDFLRNKNRNGDEFGVIGLTMYDLFESEADLFVAGMANRSQGVGVFSFARYDPIMEDFSCEFWYEQTFSNDDEDETKKLSSEKRKSLILQRSLKVLVHEICHLFDLNHCVYFACCMNGSGHLKEDYSQPIFLCPICLRKLATLVGFDVKERYRKLAEFFEIHEMIPELNWTKDRLQFLQ